MEPTLLGDRYRVDELIASGGMGTVHRGWDARLARPVALKVLHRHLAADADFERRFRAEARHAARVKHPNVVAVLDQDEHDGVPFIVMEFISGWTLRDVLRRRGRLAPDEVARMLAPTCAGLSAIHRSGIVHRDVKPENLLIDHAGVVRVGEFGIVHTLDATRCTPAGVLLGSVRYMAPEVVLGGQASAASDQYALGVMLFEALTGRAPLPADDPAAVALRHAHEDVPPPSAADPSVPTALDHVVMTAAVRRPEDRYPTVDALNAAFQAAMSGDPVAVTPARAAATIPAHRPTGVRRHPPATQRRPAPYLPTARRGPVPAERTAPDAAPHAPQGWRPRAIHEWRARTPRRPRQPLSVLAVAAVVLSLFDGVSGFVLAPVFGWIALHRITRRPGRMRGMWVAQVAIGVSALRLLDYLATRGA
jgi:eukaryotic-like serine/threonine-protein kinase